MILKSIKMKAPFPAEGRFPFDLPVIRKFGGFTFRAPVTIFAGDNGTGKTTLLEGIAAAADSILISREPLEGNASLSHAHELAEHLALSWSVKTRNGFFFRALDFVTYTIEVARMREDARGTMEEIRSRNPHSLEIQPYARTYADLRNLYGEGLEQRSHGESFLDLFQARFRPGGFYILDEPEAPLSPSKQLVLMSMLNDMVAQGAQFLISTHSPILMAYPDADLYEIRDGRLEAASFEEIEHVRMTKDFLDAPDRFLRHLFG
ncbi:AAA family ATPase [Edaphobacillus lindanitolerans]|uniref:Predicted ATPase n=1 Tax=Edaphobacillus lindanitolerans TaxID=550447 RepID=A0A1U7PM47_9BACI|nr:AAA family ATPase [Edaphobacillus lindanitolerans]SIT89245.1 Predicted ATPase [Edaphobacillus lindanitolerans]